MSHLIIRENSWESNLKRMFVYPNCNQLYCLTRTRFVIESKRVRPFLLIHG